MSFGYQANSQTAGYRCDVSTNSPVACPQANQCRTTQSSLSACEAILTSAKNNRPTCIINRDSCFPVNFTGAPITPTILDTDPSPPNNTLRSCFEFTGNLPVAVNNCSTNINTCRAARIACGNASNCNPTSECVSSSVVVPTSTTNTPDNDNEPRVIGGDPGPEIIITESLNNPIESENFVDLINKFLTALIYIAIPVSVLAVVFVGFQFVTGQGNEDKLKTAKQNALYVVIGLLIIFGARLILSIIQSTLSALS